MASIIPRRQLSTLLLLLATTITSVSALAQSYCSTQNNGGSLALESIYMSNGKCFDTCGSNYAFAIVQNDSCWCSNYVPSNQVSLSNCNQQCPGYPDDSCGNSDKGLYGYIALAKAPSGTAGSGSSSGSATTSKSSAGRTSSSSSPLSSSSTQGTTVTEEPVTLSSESSEPTSLISQPPVSSRSTSTASPVTSVQVVTIAGQGVVTQTVTSTPTSGSGAVLGTNKKSSSMAPGLIAAAVIASILGLVLIGLLAFFLLRRRKRNNEDEKFGGLRDSNGANLNRNASTHSKAGLLDRAYPPTITTRISSHGGLDMSSSDAVSPVTPSSTDRRGSRAILYDQRLNPNSLMILDNGSHTSLKTLEDHRDYGRMLKVTNPDDPPRRSIS